MTKHEWPSNNQQPQTAPHNRQSRVGCLGCLLCCLLVSGVIGAGYYRHAMFWIIVGLLVTAGIIRWNIYARRSVLRWQQRQALWEEISPQVYALPLDAARRQLLDLLDEPQLFHLIPAAPCADLTGYPASIQELFSRFATISIDEQLYVGTVLPPMHREDAFTYFTVRTPYRLVGYDLANDHDGEALVIKGTDDTLYILEDYDDPEPHESYLCPSLYHFLLARAQLVRENNG